MVKRGLYIGRFQPFHLGHFKTIQEIENMNIVDELLIAIGSPTKSYEKNNPFTLGERIEMVNSSIKNQFDLDILISSIPDTEDNAVWVSNAIPKLPKFDIVFANNPLVKLLFKEAGYDVVPTPMINRTMFSGTVIRNKILEGSASWIFHVPKTVSSFIINNNYSTRMRELNKTDSE